MVTLPPKLQKTFTEKVAREIATPRAHIRALSVVFAGVLLVVLAVLTIAADTQDVPYPENYRSWYHVNTMIINPGNGLYGAFGGIHHIYANPAAVEGYKSGDWPDGAVIVFDLLETKSADNTITEGARKVVAVMHRDATKYAATGGWGFEAFKGDSKTERLVGANAATACFACHVSQKASGFVFSKMHP